MPSNTWFQGRRVCDIAFNAERCIRDAEVVHHAYPSYTYDRIKTEKQWRYLKGAFWWMYEYQQGAGAQSVKDLVQANLNNNDWCDKDNSDHQRIARVAGLWVPGRQKGALGKNNKAKAYANQPNTIMISNIPASHNIVPTFAASNPNVMLMASGAVDATEQGTSFSPEQLANLLDTSNMSTQDIWKAVVCILTSASSDSREGKDVIHEVIQVLTPLME